MPRTAVQPQRLSVIGCGYLGAVHAAAMAELGHDVVGVDTDTSRVDVFDYDRETGLTNRRPFVLIDPDDGRANGLTVDAEGGVWVAMHRGGAVHGYRPDGGLEAVVEVPVAKTTACTFGGELLDQLFITTSREGLEPDDEPAAGSLFRAEVGVVGRPVLEFSG